MRLGFEEKNCSARKEDSKVPEPENMSTQSIPKDQRKSPSVRSHRSAGSKTSRGQSVASSTASRKLRASIEYQDQFIAMKEEFEKMTLELQLKIEEKEEMILTATDDNEKQAHQNWITLYQRKMERLKQCYDNQKTNLELKLKSENEKIDLDGIDEESEGSLISDSSSVKSSNQDGSQNNSNQNADQNAVGDQTDDLMNRYLEQQVGQAGARPEVETRFVFAPTSDDKKLPEFDGNPAKWGKFISAFKRTTARYKLDDGQNMTRLDAALKGKAKSAVEHFMDNVKNVDTIIEVLQRRFGRPEFILDNLVEKVRHAETPDPKKVNSILDFGTLVQALVTSIKTLEEDSYMHNPQLVTELIKKLPGMMEEKWFTFLLEDSNRKRDLETFSKWMDIQVRIAELRVVPDFSSEKKPKVRGAGVNVAQEDKSERRRHCVLCNKDTHYLHDCSKFKSMSINDRWNFVKEKRLCFRCLFKGHSKDKCSMKIRCKADGCALGHHTLLHQEKKPTPAAEPVSSAPPEATINVASTSSSSSSLPVIPIKIRNGNKITTCYALLDTGASCTMIESDLAEEIGLDGTDFQLNLRVLGNERKKTASKLVTMEVSGQFRHAPFYNLKDVKTISKLGLRGFSSNPDQMKENYPHLRPMKTASYRNVSPQVIIGYDNLRLFAARRILEDLKNDDSPTAYEGLLGWYVCQGNKAKEFCFAAHQIEENDDLHVQMQSFWTVESFGVMVTNENQRSQEDRKSMQMMEKYTRKTEDARWETCLLWKDEDCSLPQSYGMAKNRLVTMEKKMDRDPEFAELVQSKFEEYIQKGYLAPAQSTATPPAREWYLPWFFAYHPDKKPRYVLDAASKVNGKSLNDYLMKGPDLLEPLPSVLMRFRRHQIGIAGDIKEMFHRVLLRKEDRSCQKVLFRGMNRNVEPTVFEMQVLIFGSASSPSTAIFAKNRNAEEFGQDSPKVVMTIKRDTYVDDFLSGAETVPEAVKLQQEVYRIHEDGGFTLTKWISSNQDVVNSIPESLRAKSPENVQLSEKEDNLEKTLGLFWNPKEDVFQFQLRPKSKHVEIYENGRIPTKTEVTSIVMSLFDPLGFLAPVKIKGLIIIQDIWRTKIGWEDQVSHQINEKWQQWLTELTETVHVKIPRRLSTTSIQDAEDIQMHVFVDASEEAYAAVVYLRIQTGGSVEVSFIIGKSRVAPLKKVSVPRMELLAAVLGLRLAQTVRKSYDEMKITRTCYWSDSRTVLCWIRSTTARHNVFVGNRIGEILEGSSVGDWRWVPTQLNAADAATRSSNSSINLWLNCSGFLFDSESNWPVQSWSEEREESVMVVCPEEPEAINGLPNITRFSSWYRLIRSTAAILFLIRFKRHGGIKGITIADIRLAQELWIKKAQRDLFPEELRDLQNGGSVSKKKDLYQLSPELDEKGIVVMKGRLKKANLSKKVKNPPILHSKHPYVKLLIEWHHRIGQHWGQERIMNELRKHAWIINCRIALKQCKAECITCRKRSAVPVPPEMGQLPEARVVEGCYPFEHTGVDYFGPLLVRERRSTVKRWGVIFTCLKTRAVHLDIAHSLETSDFLNVLVRFINLRAKPEHLWSDNGTNFVGAERELREKLKEWKKNQKFITDLQVREIEWHFLPPASPHMAGSHERLILDVKKLLKTMLKEAHPTEEVLRTFLCEVTGIMNSRPITVVSVDPEDLRALTPNDLLNIPCVVGQSITGLYDESAKYRKSWEQAQQLSRTFWNRWKIEYLPWLARRKKWFEKVDPIQEGDLVLVVEDNAPRSAWKMGKIVKTYRAEDKQVRFFDVEIACVDPNDPSKKVKKTVLKRPAVKVAPLGLRVGTSSGRENVPK